MQHYEEVFYKPEYESLFLKLVCRLSYELPLYKVANSSWLQKYIEDNFKQKVPFSNNGLALKDFSPSAKLSKQDGVIRVLTYNRPEEWKGLGDAIAIMKSVKERTSKKVEWHVFGYLNAQFPPNNSICSYKLHQSLSFKELSNLYSTSDIVLCPSWYESFPLPALEAMASGTAVVTTSYGTEDYAFHGKNALVFGPRDVNSAVEHVLTLVNDETLRERLANNGVETAKSFDWENAIKNREEILLDIFNLPDQFDRFAPTHPNIFDGKDQPFHGAPIDLKLKNDKLIKVTDGHDGVAPIKTDRSDRSVNFSSVLPG